MTKAIKILENLYNAESGTEQGEKVSVDQARRSLRELVIQAGKNYDKGTIIAVAIADVLFGKGK